MGRKYIDKKAIQDNIDLVKADHSNEDICIKNSLKPVTVQELIKIVDTKSVAAKFVQSMRIFFIKTDYKNYIASMMRKIRVRKNLIIPFKFLKGRECVDRGFSGMGLWSNRMARVWIMEDYTCEEIQLRR